MGGEDSANRQDESPKKRHTCESAFRRFCEAYILGRYPDLDAYLARHSEFMPALGERISRFIDNWEHSEEFRLLQQAVYGDRDALGDLIQNLLPWLQSKASKEVRDMLRMKGDETGDYMQETLLGFVRDLPKYRFDNLGQFRCFLLRILQNTVTDGQRHHLAKRRNIAREKRLEKDDALLKGPPREKVRTPSSETAHREEMEMVRVGLEFLSPDEREIVLLRYCEELSFSRIGEILEKTADSARMQFHRAFERLLQIVNKLRKGDLDDLFEGD